MKKIENKAVDTKKPIRAAIDESEKTMDMHQKEDAPTNPAKEMSEKKSNPMLERHIDAVIEQMKEEQYFKEQAERMDRYEQTGKPSNSENKAHWQSEFRQNQRRFEYDYEEDFYEPIYEDDYE